MLNNKLKHTIKLLAPTMIWIWFIVSVYMPFLVYRMNSEYYIESFLELILPILVFVFPIIVLVFLTVGLLPKKAQKYMASLLLMFTLFIWLQGDLFSISYGQLDGLGMVFYPHDFRGILEVVVLVVLLVIGILFHKKINDISTTIIVFAMTAQIGIVGYGLLIENKGLTEKNQPLNHEVDDEIFSFSNKENVVVFILDSFGVEFFQQMLELDKSLSKKLRGFVSYTDAISQYPQTKYSLPSFLVGTMIPERANYNDFLANKVVKEGLPIQYEQGGYMVSFVSTAFIWFNEFYSKRFLYSAPTPDQPLFYSANAMKLLDFGLFRISPHFLKHHVYNKGFWFISDYMSGYSRMPDIYPTRSAKMMDYYAKKVHVADSRPRFKILHFVLPHPKFVFNQDCEFKQNMSYSNDSMLQQSICTMDKLLHILDQMKAQNVYDNSKIIVLSDHGSKMFESKAESGFPSEVELKSSGVLLMMKQRGSNDAFTQVNTPTTLLAVGNYLTQVLSGETPTEFKAEPERYFYSYQSKIGSTKSNVPDGVLYQVRPNFSDERSWSAWKTVTNKCQLFNPLGTLGLSDEHLKPYCFKYGFHDYSEQLKGTELVGSGGVFTWQTKAIQNEKNTNPYQVIVQIESNTAVDVVLKIYNDSEQATPLSSNQEEGIYTAFLDKNIFNDELKIEFYILKSKHTDHPIRDSDVVLKSIEIRAVN